MNPQITKEIIFDYLNGRATALQKKQIDEWVKSEGNEELYFQYLDEWEKFHMQYHADLDKAISEYRAFIVKHKSDDAGVSDDVCDNYQLSGHSSLTRSWLWLVSAAMLLLMFSLAGDTILYIQYNTKPGQIASWILQDGSKVTLNSNSVLKLQKDWLRAANRTVYLRGEAEFSVAHEEDNRKFVVKTDNNLDIVVLGTVFTVFNRNSHTEVILNEGEVQLQHQSGITEQKMNMVPGEKVILAKNGLLEKDSLPENDTFAPWKDHRFVFANTPLSEIEKILADNYRIKAEIEDTELASWTVSGSFKAVNYQELVSSVAAILDIEYEIRNHNTVVFSRRSGHLNNNRL